MAYRAGKRKATKSPINRTKIKAKRKAQRQARKKNWGK